MQRSQSVEQFGGFLFLKLVVIPAAAVPLGENPTVFFFFFFLPPNDDNSPEPSRLPSALSLSVFPPRLGYLGDSPCAVETHSIWAN